MDTLETVQDETGQVPGKFRKVIDQLQKSAVKPGVDLAGIVKTLKERREKKIHGRRI